MIEKKLSDYVIGDSTKCTGCRACELACFAVHNEKTNGVGKTVGTAAVPVNPRLYLTRLDQNCMPVQCKHCEDAPCLNACTKKAIKKVENQVIVNDNLCIGCKDCMMACPFGAVTLLPLFKKGKPVILNGSEEVKIVAAKCDFCVGLEDGPACVRVCPHEALRIVDAEGERLEKNIKAAESLVLTRGL